MKTYWTMSVEETMQEFGVTKQGLDNQKVCEIREKRGENVLLEGKKKSILQVFLGQFCDLLVVILIAAALISLCMGNIESTVVIFLVLILNAVLGTLQHVKAQKSLDSLKQLASPYAKVMREGQKMEIPASEVVPGDIVLLEAGDLVVADGRVLKSYSLQVNESSLTGESENVEKTEVMLEGELPLGDRINMVYSGSLVTYGRAEILITATGMETELGKIAGFMNAAKERKTPLQVSLDQFSGRLAVLIMAICAVVLLLCMYHKMSFLDSIMFAVALAVAAIPEALSSIVTIVQAMGTQKMAKENAIIKNLNAVESLGCVSVICSDKTGTLTQNKMKVKNLYIDGMELNPADIDMANPLHRYLLYNAVLANDSSIVDGKGIGDPTEYALLEMFRDVRMGNGDTVKEYGFSEEDIRKHLHRKEEIPFDSVRKLMSTKYCIHGVDMVFTKGAVDVLLERCTKIEGREGIRTITEEEKAGIQAQNQKFSQQGLRVLAFARKETTEALCLENERDYIFTGLAAMMDPPRLESKEAVEHAKSAGIRPVMITGDHKITAVAIAKEIGIFEEGDMAVTGLELDAMTEKELEEQIDHISVYARVSPENKIRIVEAWQKRGNIVAMTGDGVNDAPALKKADIGVAMGITGTEVSKDAADMILSDDNFATIIGAVANGRNVYRNIRNAILFLLSGNMAGILAVLYTSILGLPIPFAPVHLLFMNLLTDSLPAIAIGMEPSDPNLLKENPRDPSEGILTRSFLGKILWQGLLIAAVSMAAYYVGLKESSTAASTMAFAVLTLARLFHGFNCRSSRSIVHIGLHSNVYSLGAFFAGVGLLLLVLWVPFLQNVFSVVPVLGTQMLMMLGLAFLPTLVIQIGRLMDRNTR